MLEKDGVLVESPVHCAFGLTYASYFVLPRVLMEQMPYEWQEKFVALTDEFNDTFDWGDEYTVQKRNGNGKFVDDPLANYRHPNFALIESLRRKNGCQEG